MTYKLDIDALYDSPIVKRVKMMYNVHIEYFVAQYGITLAHALCAGMISQMIYTARYEWFQLDTPEVERWVYVDILTISKQVLDILEIRQLPLDPNVVSGVQSQQ